MDFCSTPRRRGEFCTRHATDAHLGRPFRRPLRSPPPEEVAKRAGQRLVNFLMHYTEKDPESRCRIWTGAADGAGYSCLTMIGPDGSRATQRTYRVIVEALTGPIPPGYHVHHTCGRTGCVSPNHLERSDARSNIGEMLTRQGYERYIRALRAALAEHDPYHWLLASRADTFDGTP